MIYCNRGCDNRMTMLANYITSFLVRYRLVEPRENEWCAYLIESRLTQMISIPFLILVGSVIAPLDRVKMIHAAHQCCFSTTAFPAQDNTFSWPDTPFCILQCGASFSFIAKIQFKFYHCISSPPKRIS